MIKNEIPLIMCLTQCWNCNNVQSYLDIIDPEHKKISPPLGKNLHIAVKILKNVIRIFMKKFNRTVTYIALGKNFCYHQMNL